MGKLLAEFREFAMKGSVIDLAVGVVIGAAFAKIIASLVANLIMPPINLVTAKYGVDFQDYAITVPVEGPELNEKGEIVKGDDGNPNMVPTDYPILKVGPFIQTMIDFLLVALGLFGAIKVYNTIKHRFEEKPPEEAPEVPEDIALLKEIRDALKAR